MSPEPTPRKKMGRPPKPEAERAKEKLTVRVSDGLYARLVEFGKTEGYSPAQVMRAWALFFEMVWEDPSVLASIVKDPHAQRTELQRLVKLAGQAEPSLPMDGLDG